MSDISFKYAEKAKNGQYVTAVSNMMQKPFPREKVIAGGSLLEEFREDEIVAAIQCLDPRKAVIGVTARELPAGIEGTFDLTEPIYGTEYKQVKVPEELLREVSS